MPQQQLVRFHSADRTLQLKSKTKIKTFITTIFAHENKQLGSLDYIFCSDEYLLQMNNEFLQHDYYTDIITFDLSEKGEGAAIQGEAYISLDRVKENAKINNASFSTETLRVIFHAALHLCGYKDKTPADEQEMREKEEFYLKGF